MTENDRYVLVSLLTGAKTLDEIIADIRKFPAGIYRNLDMGVLRSLSTLGLIMIVEAGRQERFSITQKGITTLKADLDKSVQVVGLARIAARMK